jgi:iron(III) transport system substrate-binding protein
MSKVSRRIFLGAGTALGLAACAGLREKKDNPAQNTTQTTKEVINLYSSRHYNTDNLLYQDFESQTGIKVNLVEGKGEQLLERIKSEGTNSQADIFLTADAGNLWKAQQEGIFTPVSSPILTENIPDYLRDPNNQWFGFSKRLRVIMYNKAKVKPSQLSTYEDLADSKWQKKIAIRSSSNIYNQSLVAWLINKNRQQKMEEWCKGIVANMVRPPEGGDRDQIKAVAAGIADLAVANTYYLAGYGTSNDPEEKAIFEQVGVFFPNQNEEGAHVNISGGGVLKNAPNQAGAIKFLEYLISPSAQRFFADGNNEYPVIEGIELNPVLASFGDFKSDEASVAKYGPNLAEALKIMDRAGWQ